MQELLNAVVAGAGWSILAVGAITATIIGARAARIVALYAVGAMIRLGMIR